MSKMGYAVVECGGGQLKVSEGDTVLIDEGTTGEKMEIKRVLALRTAKGLQVGNPYVEGASVTGTVGDLVKGPKETIVKYKRRKDYRLKKGHRQHYMELKVESIKEK